jgi:flavin reductase (DIM6/NTAB) family NADH-FMN oxidoreductase RutF
MEKLCIGSQVFPIPMPQAILGTVVEGRNNFMALGWLTRANHQPPMMAVTVNKANLSGAAILRVGEFSINFPSLDLLEPTDAVGLVSGKLADKSEVFETFCGELLGAPMIVKCPLCMECKLVEAVELPTNHVFVGEIVGAYSEERFLTDGKLDVEKVKPFVLTMPDNRYWSVGDCIGRAWQDGRAMADQLKKEHPI